jgi:hypothetical protein
MCNSFFLRKPPILVLNFLKKIGGSLGVGLSLVLLFKKPIILILTHFFQIQEPLAQFKIHSIAM